jgi:hypothetical protein
MTRKLLITALIMLLILVILNACSTQTPAPSTEVTAPPTTGVPEVAGVPISEIEPQHIFTSGTNVVGIGSHVAAEPYGVAAGEDPAAQPAQAFILPYAIYPNMKLDDIANFTQPDPLAEDVTFAWGLQVPVGSSAALLADDPVAIFQTDVEGDYVLALTVTDAAGNKATASWTITAGTYVGVGPLDGSSAAPNCAGCHTDQTAAWSETLHASMFTRSINGETEQYNANCITCHTTGFNNNPGANNGGFDDVAGTSGWEFPGAIEPENWREMVQDHPNAAALANIQCESCHGPGSAHFQNDPTTMGPIGMGLSYATCAQCHAEEPYHVFPQQWEVSPHSQKLDRAFWYPTGESRAACVKCHTGGGFIDSVNGVPAEEMRNTYQVITCAVCHDPHNADNPNQLRVFDSVKLPNGVEVTHAGPAATCMSCHNTRVNPVDAVLAEVTETAEGSGVYRMNLPHYSSAAELLTTGNAGYTWGEVVESSPHGTIVPDTCITCHMSGTPDEGQPGHNTVGQHTFLLTSPVDGTENIAACQQCHTDATSFDFEAKDDYDGDGAAETNHEELEGLLELLRFGIEARGVTFLPSHPYYGLPQAADENLKGAVYNYHLALETVHRNAEVHNVQYLVGLLRLSFEKLTGAPVP